MKVPLCEFKVGMVIPGTVCSTRCGVWIDIGCAKDARAAVSARARRHFHNGDYIPSCLVTKVDLERCWINVSITRGGRPQQPKQKASKKWVPKKSSVAASCDMALVTAMLREQDDRQYPFKYRANQDAVNKCTSQAGFSSGSTSDKASDFRAASKESSSTTGSVDAWSFEDPWSKEAADRSLAPSRAQRPVFKPMDLGLGLAILCRLGDTAKRYLELSESMSVLVAEGASVTEKLQEFFEDYGTDLVITELTDERGSLAHRTVERWWHRLMKAKGISVLMITDDMQWSFSQYWIKNSPCAVALVSEKASYTWQVRGSAETEEEFGRLWQNEFGE